MDKYQLNGFYKYSGAPNGRGDLEGELELNDDGSFESIIKDYGSRTLEWEIKGHLVDDPVYSILTFLKLAPKMNLANIAYAVHRHRTRDDKSFEGKYIGDWGALPHKIEFNKDYNLFIAKIDMSVAGISDNAEINLIKK